MYKYPLVTIIVVNWNGGETFRNCLKSLKKLSYRNWELIVVDNGSTDGTQDLATIRNSSNLGFATANNQGWQEAHGQYILLLNNDTLVEPDFLTKLVAHIEAHPEVGVVQPKIKIMDNSQYLDTVGSFLTWTGFLQHWGYLQADRAEFAKEAEIFSAKGACMLIRRQVIDKVGLFDSDFGSYFEETDFCWRVWLAGWRILYYPHTYILHKVGFTSKRLDPIGVNYHSFKNRLCSLIKNLQLSSFYILLIHLSILINLSIFYLVRLQVSKFNMIWKAISWNIIHLFSTLSKRSQAQKFRTLSDKQIFLSVLRPFNYRSMISHFLRSEN